MVELSLETLEKAQAGNLEAYRSFVNAFERPIHHTVYRLVGSRFAADVEDITQDLFLKLYRALPQFEPERGTKLTSWVFTFVKNYCFDILKKRRLPTVSIDRGSGDDARQIPLPTTADEPRETLAGREIQEAVARAVEQLPREQRYAFILREYENFSYAEIAEITRCSEGTVKSRIHRAKEALRYRLRGLVVDSERP